MMQSHSPAVYVRVALSPHVDSAFVFGLLRRVERYVASLCRADPRPSLTHTQTHRHCTLVHAVCRSPRVCTATDTVRATLFVTGGDAVSFVICDSRLTPLRTRRLCCFQLLGKGGALRPRVRSTRLSTAPSSSSARLVQTRPGSTDHAMMPRESRKSRLYSEDERAVLLLALWISSAAAVAACM